MNSKKGVIPVCLISIFVLMSFISCDKETDNNEEMIVIVASVKKILSHKSWMEVYWIKEEGSRKWTNGWDITGFNHEEGHEYKLRIRSEKWPDDIRTIGPLPPSQYILLEILSDQEKESEGIPDQYLTVSVASRKNENGNYYVSFGHHCEEVVEIRDFEYEEGYEYGIQISAHFFGQYAKPRYAYNCINVDRKEKKDSEWIPENSKTGY